MDNSLNTNVSRVLQLRDVNESGMSASYKLTSGQPRSSTSRQKRPGTFLLMEDELDAGLTEPVAPRSHQNPPPRLRLRECCSFRCRLAAFSPFGPSQIISWALQFRLPSKDNTSDKVSQQDMGKAAAEVSRYHDSSQYHLSCLGD